LREAVASESLKSHFSSAEEASFFSATGALEKTKGLVDQIFIMCGSVSNEPGDLIAVPSGPSGSQSRIKLSPLLVTPVVSDRPIRLQYDFIIGDYN
jgi:hypothetical protein